MITMILPPPPLYNKEELLKATVLPELTAEVQQQHTYNKSLQNMLFAAQVKHVMLNIGPPVSKSLTESDLNRR